MTQAVKEIELCFLCEIRDREGLDRADSVEEHEQWEYKLPPNEDGSRRGRQRIRKTTTADGVSYTMTIKAPLDASKSAGDDEQNIVVDAAFFECWKKTFQPSGQIKTRYKFVSNKTTIKYNDVEVELPQLVYEIDILRNAKGLRGIYGKVDVEIQDALTVIKQRFGDKVSAALFKFDFSRLPLDIGRVVDCGTKDPAERKEIDEYFAFFSVPFSATIGGADDRSE